MKFKHSFYFLLLISLIFNSCKKNTSYLGLDVLPASDRIHLRYTDTITCDVKTDHTFHEIITGPGSSSLGKITDPIFGITSASFFTKFANISTTVPAKTSTADSIILYLKKSYYYGDSNAVHTVRVYKWTKPTEDTSVIKSNVNINDYYNSSEIIGEGKCKFKDSMIRITLKKSFANEILSNDSTTFLSYSTFFTSFPGLYITTDTNATGGSLAFFNLSSTTSRIDLYYHDQAITATDTTSIQFYMTYTDPISSNLYLFSTLNYFTHNYNGTKVSNALNQKNQDSLAFIQSGSGLMIKVSFPYLNNNINKDSAQIINKADLVIKLDANEEKLTGLVKCSQLYLYAFSDSIFPYSEKYRPFSDSYVGGAMDTVNISYTFNITSMMQDFFKQKGKYPVPVLYLVPKSDIISYNGIVASLKKKKIQLRLTYSNQ